MRGDAKLLEIKNGNTPSSDDLVTARKKIFEDIQNNKSESCNGCPFLYERNSYPKFTNEINHLSIEHHSVCNLRCNYCSEIYFGGKRSSYDVVKFIQYLSESGSFKNCKQVVWGGGEPTLDKSFELIVNEIDKSANPNIYHRVFTNSVRYHDAIKKFLERGLIKIVTSIDSGSRENFKKVRGRDKFFDVFENLKTYSSIDPSKVTIKYIFTEDNCEEKELEGFVNNCLKYNLINCCFQLSLNFKYEDLKLSILKKISYLMGLFKKSGIKKFFCDDHISSRFKKLNSKEKYEILNYLKNKKFENIFINNDKIKNINIFGIGDIAINMLNKTDIKNQFEKILLYDNNPEKIGTKVQNLIINKPDSLLSNNYKIYISVAQSYDEIYSNLVKMNVDKNRVVSGLFI